MECPETESPAAHPPSPQPHNPDFPSSERPGTALCTAETQRAWRRYGMFAPSAIAAVVAVVVVLFQKASPESLGYASVNAPKQSSGAWPACPAEPQSRCWLCWLLLLSSSEGPSLPLPGVPCSCKPQQSLGAWCSAPVHCTPAPGRAGCAGCHCRPFQEGPSPIAGLRLCERAQAEPGCVVRLAPVHCRARLPLAELAALAVVVSPSRKAPAHLGYASVNAPKQSLGASCARPLCIAVHACP